MTLMPRDRRFVSGDLTWYKPKFAYRFREADKTLVFRSSLAGDPGLPGNVDVFGIASVN